MFALRKKAAVRPVVGFILGVSQGQEAKESGDERLRLRAWARGIPPRSIRFCNGNFVNSSLNLVNFIARRMWYGLTETIAMKVDETNLTSVYDRYVIDNTWI